MFYAAALGTAPPAPADHVSMTTKTSLLLCLALALALALPAATDAAQTRPNVVVIHTDDQDAASMAVMSRTRALLGTQGTTFVNSFASYPLCCPSRATFLTGQYGHNHGVLGNNPPQGGFVKLKGANTLAVWLQRSGYHTALVGKYLNGYGERDPREVPPGWSDWHGSVDPSSYQYYATTINRNGRLVTTGRDAASYQTDVYARMASDIVRRRARSAQPFFLWTNFLAPHDSSGEGDEDAAGNNLPVPAPRHQARFAQVRLPRSPALNESDVSDKPALVRALPSLTPAALASIRVHYQKRLASLLAVDEAVARIVATLRATGELNRTLIVFTSDNGYLQGEHRLPEGKSLLYEPSVRVPLLMRGPGVPRGVRRTQLVANIDLAPTILAAARARPGLAQDGLSLLGLARNPRAGLGRGILFEDGQRGDTKEYVAIRTPGHVYAEYANGDRELYDLRADRFQLRSLHGSAAHAALRRALAARLAALRACRGAACRAG
jgi:arylsulfatase A-like enzyme